MDLRSYRREHGLTVNQLAAIVGVGRVTMYRYLRGSRIPETQILAQILETTKGEVEPNDLFPRVAFYRRRRAS